MLTLLLYLSGENNDVTLLHGYQLNALITYLETQCHVNISMIDNNLNK